MVKLRIEYDKAGCIGAAVCFQFAPQTFPLDKDGKADLAGHTMQGNLQVLELEVADPEPILNAARGCPVLIIKVFDAATGKQLAP